MTQIFILDRINEAIKKNPDNQDLRYITQQIFNIKLTTIDYYYGHSSPKASQLKNQLITSYLESIPEETASLDKDNIPSQKTNDQPKVVLQQPEIASEIQNILYNDFPYLFKDQDGGHHIKSLVKGAIQHPLSHHEKIISVLNDIQNKERRKSNHFFQRLSGHK